MFDTNENQKQKKIERDRRKTPNCFCISVPKFYEYLKCI